MRTSTAFYRPADPNAAGGISLAVRTAQGEPAELAQHDLPKNVFDDFQVALARQSLAVAETINADLLAWLMK